MTNRVVVTGFGAITPIGSGRETLMKGLLEGRSGISQVTSFDTSNYPVHVGAEIPDFNLADYLPDVDPVNLGRATQLALAAASLALKDAKVGSGDFNPLRSGVRMGTTSGEPNLIERFNDAYLAEAQQNVGSELALRYPCDHMPLTVARQFNFTGLPPVMHPAACAAGNYAIADATEALLAGRADIMLAGGSDAFSRITYTGFSRLHAIAPEICRPFSNNRLGMIPGEGAGFLVLETLEHAVWRGASIMAEIAGYGLSCDAHHMTGSHPEGRGAARAMEKALHSSRLRPEDVDYISAHGTGTKSNDRNETFAVKRVFGERAYKIPMSSIKSMLGHTMGAASAIEAGVCAHIICHGAAPPTMNYDEPDPECDLDYIPNQARQIPVKVAMNNAYAFGGANASLILKTVEGC